MAEQVYFEDVNVGDELPEVVETVDEVQMFFFSAATNNGHRIHYDTPYTTEVEQRPGILVHGPLQAALLAKMVTDWHGPPASCGASASRTAATPSRTSRSSTAARSPTSARSTARRSSTSMSTSATRAAPCWCPARLR